MASEGLVFVSVASIVEDMIKQHGSRLSDIDLTSRKVDEAEAWMGRTVGVVEAKDLPEAPSKDEFKFGVRNGIILCNALNKVVSRSVPKVVEIMVVLNAIADGAAISAYQYFENVRNFLVVK